MEIEERFEQFDNEFNKFENIKVKYANSPHIHAFVLIGTLFPYKDNTISAAEHDEVVLNIDDSEIEILSDEDILTLVRCGVLYSDGYLKIYV